MQALSIPNALILSAILIIAGKITGFLRDLIMAIVYGADKTTDAYFAANIIPSLSLTAFYSTITLAFMPLYIRKLKKAGKTKANNYANAMLLVYLVITAIITAIMIFSAPFLVSLIAPTFDAKTTELTIDLVYIFSLSFFFSVSCAFFSAIQYAHDIRLGQQISPLINNTIFIIAIMLFGHFYDIRFAAIMTIVGWVVQLPIQFYFTRYKFSFKSPTFVAHEDITALLKLSGPIFAALFLEQGIMATAVYFAGQMEEGSVSIINYANKLSNLPLTLAVMLVTIYIYPAMTRLAADENQHKFHAYLGRMTRLVLMLSVPAVIICWFQGETIAKIAFGTSKLSTQNIKTVGTLFSVYMIGIFFLILRDLINRYFYARTKAINIMIVTTVFVALNFIFTSFLVDIYGLEGVAMATVLAAIIAFIVQFFLFYRIASRSSGILSPDLTFITTILFGASLMIALFLLSSQTFESTIITGILTSVIASLNYLGIFYKGYGFSFLRS